MTSTAHRLKGFADEFGVTLPNEAQATLPPQLCGLHRAILSAFLDSGAAPTTAWITDRARQIGVDPDDAMVRLDHADLVHTADGAVTVAYPFSGTATPHRVRLDGGPATWAMCAVDALGIPLMTGRGATITSTDPRTGEPIRIRWGDGTWAWEPDSTVMLVAGTTGCSTVAETACGHFHFFASPEHVEAHLRANPTLEAGEIYDQASAVEAGQIIFGSLLG